MLFVLYRAELFERSRAAIASGAVLLATLLLIAPFWLSEAGMARASAAAVPDLASFAGNYLSYFSPRFLFFHGDWNLRHSAVGYGVLLRVEILTTSAGLFFIARRRRREDLLLLAWLALFPIAASLTEPRHALRSLVGVPALALLSGVGGVSLCRSLPSSSLRRVAAVALAVLWLVSSAGFLRHYFVDYPRYSAPYWQHGMAEALRVSRLSGASCVVISDRAHLPHIFHLFYNRVPPAIYQAAPVEGLRQNHWVVRDYSLGDFHVASLPEATRRMPDCVFIAVGADDMDRVAEPAEVLRVIADPEGVPLVTVFRPAR
jgi:hypothetical protein